MARELLCRVTIKDCDVQTFRAGGKGGQNQNKRDTGVRVIHRASGATGESREHRGQLENKRAAFRRMGESPEFRRWCTSLLSVQPELSRAAERVRTYHLVDRRVKDHLSGRSTSRVEDVLDGDLDLVR